MKSVMHMSSSIQGLLRNLTAKKLDTLFEMKRGEAKKELLKLQALGHKLIPSDNCKHFDPFGGGCQCRFYDDNGNKIQEETK